MTNEMCDLLMIAKDLLEICRYKCSPSDEVVRADGITNEQVMVGAMRTIERAEAEKKASKTLRDLGDVGCVIEEAREGTMRFGPGSRSNAEIRRRNGGVKHQFEDDIGGCSANYR